MYGQQEKYNKFRDLLSKTFFRPFQTKLTEEEKLQFFLSLLRDNALEFQQTLHINPETALQTSWQESERSIRDKTSKKFHETHGINSKMNHKQWHLMKSSKNTTNTVANKPSGPK